MAFKTALLASRLSNSAISRLTHAPHSPAIQIDLINLAGITGIQAAQGVPVEPFGPSQLKNDVGRSGVEAHMTDQPTSIRLHVHSLREAQRCNDDRCRNAVSLYETFAVRKVVAFMK